jgi:hypothetical protein
MNKGRSLLRWGGLLPAVAAVLVFGTQGLASITGKSQAKRPDVIKIEVLKKFGDLERPVVTFLHDKHSEAVREMGKDCTACHEEKDGKLVLMYKRDADLSRQAVMDIYHDNCITCHKEAAGRKLKSGPVTCNECHDRKNQVVSSRARVGLDKSLHYRHDKAFSGKCEKCHHAYNEKKKELFYDKGRESSCRYCHGEQAVDNKDSFRAVAHRDCLGCHVKLTARKKDAGPIQCAGCHDAEVLVQYKVPGDIPRMKRNQPDAAIIKKGKIGTMHRVAFNHKAHEGYTDNCRVCHHKAMTACNDCHTVTGEKKGGFVTLETAMHRFDNDTSCFGCHTGRQQAKNCAGCHSLMEKRKRKESATCLSCHTTPGKTLPADAGEDELAAIAMIELQGRKPDIAIYSEKEIPEEVVIKQIADKFEAVKFPHRKVVNKLMSNMQGNKLAGYFHTQPGTMCQGCHHNSPAAATPPRCASCHIKPVDNKELYRPGLMAAYHRQCMGCHTKMGIEKPSNVDCTGCHLEKK